MRQLGLPIEFLQPTRRRSKSAWPNYELGMLSEIICFFWWISGKIFGLGIGPSEAEDKGVLVSRRAG
jgi:hypothetical protein